MNTSHQFEMQSGGNSFPSLPFGCFWSRLGICLLDRPKRRLDSEALASRPLFFLVRLFPPSRSQDLTDNPF